MGMRMGMKMVIGMKIFKLCLVWYKKEWKELDLFCLVCGLKW